MLEREMKALVDRLSTLRVRTWLVIDTPAGDQLNPIVAFEKNPSNPSFCVIPLESYSSKKERVERLFVSLRQEGVGIVDASLPFCDSKVCSGGSGEIAWYRDGGHLTDAGARAAAGQFLPVFASPNDYSPSPAESATR
jgi:hypothetical protein